jgi:hypothetical protein
MQKIAGTAAGAAVPETDDRKDQPLALKRAYAMIVERPYQPKKD